MAVSDWSTTPALNVSINGINIQEECPPGNLNNMGRNIMADVKAEFDGLPSVTGKVDADGGVFSGTQPTYTGRGAFMHHNDPANASGRVYFLPEGSTTPSLANGDMVFFYT